MSHLALKERIEDKKQRYGSPELSEQTQRSFSQWGDGMYFWPRERGLSDFPAEITRILKGEYKGVLIHINRNLYGDVVVDGTVIELNDRLVQLRKLAEYDILKIDTGVFAGSVGIYTYVEVDE